MAIQFAVNDNEVGKFAIKSFVAATTALKEDKIDVYGDCEIIHTNKDNIKPKKSRNGKKENGQAHVI
mgnify:CR=1 FL=1